MFKFSQSIGLFLLACKERRQVVRVPRSKLGLKLFYLFYKEGLIKGITLSENLRELLIFLKYVEHKPLIKGFKFISKPSQQIYVSKNKLIKFFYGYGFYIISTSKSGLVFLHKYFKEQNVSNFGLHGGQLFFQIYI